MAIDQLVPVAGPDRTTRAALALRDALRAVGRSDVYALHGGGALGGEIESFDRYAAREAADPRTDVLCVHAAPPDVDVLEVAAGRPERLVVACSSVPSPTATREYDKAAADALDAWHRALHDAATGAQRVLAGSPAAARAVAAEGRVDVTVVPPLVSLATLEAVEPHVPTARHLEAVEGPLAVFAAPLWPGVAAEDVIQAYHVLATYLLPEARLAVLGGHPVRRYADALQTLVYELQLAGAWLAGPVPPDVRSAYYRHAAVVVTTAGDGDAEVSRLDAATFGVPVVARGAQPAAKPFGSSVVLDASDDVRVMAEAMARLVDLTRAEAGRPSPAEAADTWRRELTTL